jgi:hypothetical protein
MMPVGILSGVVDLVGEEDADGNIIEDPTPQYDGAREVVPSLVLELYRYWKMRRQR